MGKLKFIYFDVGGVALLDFSKTNKWLQLVHDLGIQKHLVDKFTKLFKEFEPRFCTGEIMVDQFVAEAGSKFGLSFPDDYSMLDDFVNRFEKNPEIAPLVDRLASKYKLGLLTNMYPGMFPKIAAQGLLPEVKWDLIIDSSLVNLRKPQDQIYEYAEQKAGFQPGEILFIENQAKNLEPARKRGWQTLLYDPAEVVLSNQKIRKLTKIDLMIK